MPNMFSVSGFCAHHSVSRSLFYRLQKEERGPRLTKIGRRTLITAESAAEWRARMERETSQKSEECCLRGEGEKNVPDREAA